MKPAAARRASTCAARLAPWAAVGQPPGGPPQGQLSLARERGPPSHGSSGWWTSGSVWVPGVVPSGHRRGEAVSLNLVTDHICAGLSRRHFCFRGVSPSPTEWLTVLAGSCCTGYWWCHIIARGIPRPTEDVGRPCRRRSGRCLLGDSNTHRQWKHRQHYHDEAFHTNHAFLVFPLEDRGDEHRAG